MKGSIHKAEAIKPREDLFTSVLVVGSGLGSLATAYYLSQNNISYTIVTKGKVPKHSNTTIANANTRVPNSNDIDAFIDLTVKKCGSDRSIIETIYKNSETILEFYNELQIDVKKSVMGFIPSDSIMSYGGRLIIASLLQRIKKPICGKYLVSVDKHEDGSFISLLYDVENDFFTRVVSNYLVLGTGGYGSLFSNNDNAKCATGEGLVLAQQFGAHLKGMSTVMFHPWSIYNGRKILVGEIVSLSQGKIIDNDGKHLFLDDSLFQSIATNHYHESFDEILGIQFSLLKDRTDTYLDMSA